MKERSKKYLYETMAKLQIFVEDQTDAKKEMAKGYDRVIGPAKKRIKAISRAISTDDISDASDWLLDGELDRIIELEKDGEGEG